MNDYELDRALDAIHQGRADLVDPPRLHERALAVPTEYPRHRGWLPRIDTGGFTMFSVVKFVVAGVIVALFGGFLLAGVLTTQQPDEALPAAVTESPSPEATSEPTEAPTTSVRTDILPGVELTVAEVEAGVFRVVSDGVQDLVLGGDTDVVAGHDDGIWLLRKNRFFRLGAADAQTWPTGGGPASADFEVTPDGTAWVVMGNGGDPSKGNLFSFDSEGWTRVNPSSGEVPYIVVAPDGTLWASWGGQARHLGPTGWQTLAVEPMEPDLEPGSPNPFYVTDAGDLYGNWFGLHRYEDGVWRNVTAVFDLYDVGPDGTIWQLGPLVPWRPDGGVYGHLGEGLARYVDGEWELWGRYTLTDMGLGVGFSDEFTVAPDGSLWAARWQEGDDPRAAEGRFQALHEPAAAVRDGSVACDGVARFDGKTADRFLPGRCITMDIAADGSVWVLADEGEGRDLYVITPEAVAASE